jgi:hypothetical protein
VLNLENFVTHFFPNSIPAQGSYINNSFPIEPVGSMILVSGHENDLKYHLSQGFAFLIDGK